jgi:hypothetical protein
MAYVNITYQKHSFEENPGLITWVQLFLIKFIQTIENRPEWTFSMIEEWKMNLEVEIYKYIFDEEILDDTDKVKWCINFLINAIERLSSMNITEFSSYINEEINPTVDFERIKKITINIKLMLENKEPQKTF